MEARKGGQVMSAVACRQQSDGDAPLFATTAAENAREDEGAAILWWMQANQP